MKIHFYRMTLLISFLLVSACAPMQITLPGRYDLGDELEEVAQIKDMRIGSGRAPSFTEIEEQFENPHVVIARRDTFTLSETKNDWTRVDMQSLILRNGPDEFYLLVLQNPANDLMTVDTISFFNMLNIIRAKKDFVEIAAYRYGIERIYKIDGNDKMLAIKNRILAGS